jgi:DNA-directed RNA polymerase subunit RPC12/RpoP
MEDEPDFHYKFSKLNIKKKQLKIETNFNRCISPIYYESILKDNNINDNSPTLKNKNIRCFFCNGNHLCRKCPIEEKIAPLLKKKVGDYMEYHVANNYSCPKCLKKTLIVLGNNSPSLDILCKECGKKIEVKSKCLSVKNLPNDINLQHGNYIDYNKRQKSGLDFIVVIYSVDRINKVINIREVLYMDDALMKDSSIIRVTKRNQSSLSTIEIKDRNSPRIKKLKIKKTDSFISFKKQVIDMINDHPIKVDNKSF